MTVKEKMKYINKTRTELVNNFDDTPSGLIDGIIDYNLKQIENRHKDNTITIETIREVVKKARECNISCDGLLSPEPEVAYLTMEKVLGGELAAKVGRNAILRCLFARYIMTIIALERHDYVLAASLRNKSQ